MAAYKFRSLADVYGGVPKMDIAATDVGNPEFRELLQIEISSPDWKWHDPKNTGVPPCRAVETIVQSLGNLDLLKELKVFKSRLDR